MSATDTLRRAADLIADADPHDYVAIGWDEHDEHEEQWRALLAALVAEALAEWLRAEAQQIEIEQAAAVNDWVRKVDLEWLHSPALDLARLLLGETP